MSFVCLLVSCLLSLLYWNVCFLACFRTPYVRDPQCSQGCLTCRRHVLLVEWIIMILFKTFPKTPWHIIVLIEGGHPRLGWRKYFHQICLSWTSTEPLTHGIFLCVSSVDTDLLLRVCKHTRDCCVMWNPPTQFPRLSSSPSEAACSYREAPSHRGDEAAAEDRPLRVKFAGWQAWDACFGQSQLQKGVSTLRTAL